jgi:membrane fusion protein, multidrug efflux system
MTLIRRYLWFIIAGAIVVSVVYAITAQTQQRPSPGGRFRGGEGPVPVLAAAATRADVPVYLDGVGTTRALNTVTVRPQVDGKLIKISFKEGQDVERGDVIAEIDPTTYQAQLDQAKAKKAQDEAQLANARLDLERYTRLATTNAVNRQQVDTQKALVAQFEAQVNLDQAAIDNSQAILEYTKITAPISGRTGIRLVDMGNIVKAADLTGIVVITQIRPISVLFSLPQQQLARVNAAFAQGPLPVEALGSDSKTVVGHGTLQVVDNQVDQSTGTVKLKAEFPNTDLHLWPGQFVNVRLLIDTLRNVVVVPTASVQRGPTGTFVYVIADDKVSVRPVTVSQQDDMQTVIASGLQPSERVVTTGFARLSEGSAVTVGNAGASEPPQQPSGQPRRRRGDGAPPQGTSREETPSGRQRSDAAPLRSVQ